MAAVAIARLLWHALHVSASYVRLYVEVARALTHIFSYVDMGAPASCAQFSIIMNRNKQQQQQHCAIKNACRHNLSTCCTFDRHNTCLLHTAAVIIVFILVVFVIIVYTQICTYVYALI